MPPGEPRGGAGLARLDRLPPFISDRWPLYLALWLVLVAAALFPVVADRLAAPDEPPLAPLLARLPSLTGEAGAIRLAWSHDLARSPLVTNRASPLPQHPTLLHPWWWGLAQVGRGLEHAAPDLRWATFTILFAAVLILGLKALLRATLPDGGTRALAAVLTVLGGGWRWLHFTGDALDLVGQQWFYAQFWSPPLAALKQGTAFGSPVVDTWIAPERLAIVATQAVLLACAAYALRARSWRIAIVGWLGAGIALAASQPLTPATFHIAAPATILAILVAAGSGVPTIRQRLQIVAGIPLVLGLAWPVYRWYLELPPAEPAWAYLWGHPLGGNPNDFLVLPGFVLMTLGTAAAGGLAWAIARVAGAHTRLHPHTAALLYCWALCGVFLLAVPLGYSAVRPLDMATLAGLPLALLTADLLAIGLAGLLSRRSHLVVVGLALLAGVPSIGFYAAAVHYEANAGGLGLSGTDATVIAELHRRGSLGDLAFSNDEQLDRLILSATNKRIASGWLTELRGHMKALRRQFFVEPATPQRQSELLEGLGVRFVLYRPGRGRPPHPSPLLRQVAAGDTLTLWEVQPPPFEPLGLAAGDLVRGPFGQIYVYDGRHRRWIRDIATFTARGYRWEEVQQVSGWQLATIPEGYPLPKATPAPA
ncbi:MAG: hypothetical protein OXU67_09450 [Chloroflexota bacterium]|nr:hypothetical protein [Chloroflexota bacterium]